MSGRFYVLPQNVPAELLKNKQNNFFIENKGQWDKQVKFLAKLSGLNAWITDNGIVFDFYTIDKKETIKKDSFMRPLPDNNFSIRGHVIKMKFPENAGKEYSRKYTGQNPQEAYYSYFVKRNNQTIGFKASAYDKTKKLIIDPFIYSTYLGGTLGDCAYGITVDHSGCSYVTGSTS